MNPMEDSIDPTMDLTAAELALELLEGEERANALRRVLAEPDFAAEVAKWNSRFGDLFETWPEAEPSHHAEARLMQAIQAREIAPVRFKPRFWQAWSAVATAAAAVLLLMVVARAPETKVAPAQPALAAALVPVSGAASMAAVYYPASGRLTMPASWPSEPGRSAQLWMIGDGKRPHSLGLLAQGSRTELTLPTALRSRMVNGVVLAISIEPLGGSTTGLPTGPVVAKGLF